METMPGGMGIICRRRMEAHSLGCTHPHLPQRHQFVGAAGHSQHTWVYPQETLHFSCQPDTRNSVTQLEVQVH